jgi:hypothetical protein
VSDVSLADDNLATILLDPRAFLGLVELANSPAVTRGATTRPERRRLA